MLFYFAIFLKSFLYHFYLPGFIMSEPKVPRYRWVKAVWYEASKGKKKECMEPVPRDWVDKGRSILYWPPDNIEGGFKTAIRHCKARPRGKNPALREWVKFDLKWVSHTVYNQEEANSVTTEADVDHESGASSAEDTDNESSGSEVGGATVKLKPKRVRKKHADPLYTPGSEIDDTESTQKAHKTKGKEDVHSRQRPVRVLSPTFQDMAASQSLLPQAPGNATSPELTRRTKSPVERQQKHDKPVAHKKKYSKNSTQMHSSQKGKSPKVKTSSADEFASDDDGQPSPKRAKKSGLPALPTLQLTETESLDLSEVNLKVLVANLAADVKVSIYYAWSLEY